MRRRGSPAGSRNSAGSGSGTGVMLSFDQTTCQEAAKPLDYGHMSVKVAIIKDDPATRRIVAGWPSCRGPRGGPSPARGSCPGCSWGLAPGVLAGSNMVAQSRRSTDSTRKLSAFGGCGSDLSPTPILDCMGESRRAEARPTEGGCLWVGLQSDALHIDTPARPFRRMRVAARTSMLAPSAEAVGP